MLNGSSLKRQWRTLGVVKPTLKKGKGEKAERRKGEKPGKEESQARRKARQGGKPGKAGKEERRKGRQEGKAGNSFARPTFIKIMKDVSAQKAVSHCKAIAIYKNYYCLLIAICKALTL